MKRILVPVDFSSNAYNALFYATRLFQNQPCHFYILNAFEVNTPLLTSRLDTGKGDLLFQKLSKESEEKLVETKHRIVRDTAGLQHDFETISISKELSETINKTIKSKSIDWVIMGTKGATGAKEIFMGSNTSKVIRKNKACPVLMVPDELEFEIPREIAFSSDFKKRYVEKEIKPLVDLAVLFDSKIRIFHIHEEEKLDELQQYNFAALKKYLKDFDPSIHWISKFSKKTKLINDFIKKMEVNMLVMVNNKHSLIDSITHEPVIKNIGFHPIVPFFVIPDAD